jgi:hypothetical protein
MMYWTGAEVRPRASELCMTTVHLKEKTGLPVYGKSDIEGPIHVKVSDDYIGACWLHLSNSLAGFFPADIHPDGFPYHDSPGYCLALRPRAAFVNERIVQHLY